MAQFRVGKATVVQGQQSVVFTDAVLDGNGAIAANNLFSFSGENVWYQIASVAVSSGSLVSVVLTTPYAGASKTAAAYAIQRNFSVNLSLPLIEYGDINGAGLVQSSLTTLDTALALLGQVDGPIDGTMSPIYTLREGVTNAYAEKAGLQIFRDGLSAIGLYYTGDESWKRWTIGNEDLEVNGRIALGRVLSGGEKFAVAGNATIDGNLSVLGNLTVSGDTITINAGQLEVEDAVISVGVGNESATAPYLGIKAHRGTTDAFFVYDESDDRWTAYTSTDDLATRTLGVIEAGTFVGALTGNASTATTLATARTISLSTDATGSASFNGSANITIAMTLANSGVGAGTYTKMTVDAKGRVTAGTTMTNADVVASLGYTPFQPSDAASANTASKLVQRDASGNFTAGTITATAVTATTFTGTLSGSATTAGRWGTARSITLTTDASGTVSFDGSANFNLAVTLAASGVGAGTYSNLVIDAKGRVTGARAINSADVTTGLGFTPLNAAGGTVSGNLTVTGDLLVQGTLTQVNTTTIEVDDPIMTLAKGNASGTAPFIGIKAERGSAGADAFFVWNEATDRWTAYTSTDDLGSNAAANIAATTFIGALSGNATTATTLATARTINGVSFNGSANISFTTDAVAEGATNKYFSQALARAAFTAGSGIVINAGTGVISVSASAPVMSVAGRNGDVVLATADITGLDTALAGKAALTGAVFTGTIDVRDNVASGYVSLKTGNNTRPGAVEFITADGTRRGYLGYKATGNALVLTAENTWTLEIQAATHFTGNVTLADNVTLSLGAATRQMLNLHGTAYALGVQSSNAYLRTGGGFAVFLNGVHSNTALDAGAGGSVLFNVSNTEIKFKGSDLIHIASNANVLPGRVVKGMGMGENLLFNGGFEESGDKWALGSTGTIINDTATAIEGERFLRVTKSGGSISNSDFIPVLPGQTYSASMSVKADAASALGAYLRVFWFKATKAASTVLGNTDAYQNNALTTSWVRVGGVVTAPSDATFAQIGVYHTTSSTATTMDVDAIRFNRTHDALDFASNFSFTGSPTSTTPSTADNSTRIATTAHVQANMALKADKSGATFTGAVWSPSFLSTGAAAALGTQHRDNAARISFLYATGTITRIADDTVGDLLTLPSTGNATFLGRTLHDSGNLTITTQARNLLDDTTAAAMRATIGANPAVTAVMASGGLTGDLPTGTPNTRLYLDFVKGPGSMGLFVADIEVSRTAGGAVYAYMALQVYNLTQGATHAQTGESTVDASPVACAQVTRSLAVANLIEGHTYRVSILGRSNAASSVNSNQMYLTGFHG